MFSGRRRWISPFDINEDPINIASFNVKSVNARLPVLLRWLAVRFANGHTDDADCVIGADGIMSLRLPHLVRATGAAVCRLHLLADAIGHWRRLADIRELTGLLKLAAAQVHEEQWDDADASVTRLRARTWPTRFSETDKEIRELEKRLEEQLKR